MVGEKLAALMIDAGKHSIPESEKAGLVFGTVTSASPLKIQVRNEPKLILTEEFLLLSPLCLEKKDYYDRVLWRGLKTGDNVFMLRVKQGNLFYVFQREGDLSAT